MIVGLKEEAKFYLGKFSWGHSFIELNDELLELYSKCKDSKEILEVQQKYLDDTEKARDNKNCDDMWPTSSSSSETEESDDEKEKPSKDDKT
jgi:pre-rRNA-processing protein TSR3